MAHPTYSGKEFKITIDSVIHRFKSFSVDVMNDDRDTTPSDGHYVRRATGTMDAKITVTGYESDDSGAGTFALLAALALTNTAPSALSWTDDGTTPATRLPADFFTTHFPLSDWRIRNPKGGNGGPKDTAEWSCDLTPNHD